MKKNVNIIILVFIVFVCYLFGMFNLTNNSITCGLLTSSKIGNDVEEDVFNDYIEEQSNFNYDKIKNEVYTSAKSMALVDANSYRLLVGKNYEQKLPMASTTKVVTALTVLNNCSDVNQEVLVSDKAIGIPGTSIYLRKGEKLTVKELLYGLMLSSGNDAAVALAIHVSGSIQEFCEEMKKTAISCGALNSSFDNPHGLDSKNHYTTALDLALITSKALENETFKEIVTTKNITIKGTNEGEKRYLKNKNKLLTKLDGCIGVKTGFTNDAGRCLVSAVEKDGKKLVCVVLNCGPMFEESMDILNYGLDYYTNYELLAPYNYISNVAVLNGKKDKCKIYTKNSCNYLLNSFERSQIEYIYDIPASIEAGLKKDTVIGELKIYLNKNLIFSEKIYTMEEIESIDLSKKLEDIIEEWF